MPRYAELFFGLLAMLALARIVWLAVPVNSQLVQPLPAQISGSVHKAAVVNHARAITDRNLFGSASQTAPVTDKPIAAPETTLNIQLRGILRMPDAAASVAIIAKGGEENAYGIGDSIQSGVTVHEIYADRVIIDRNGSLETLTLPKTELNSSEAAVDEASYVEARPMDKVRQYHQQILMNPKMLGDLVRTVPYREEGKLIGYRLVAKKEPELLVQLGLMPDDVIIELNNEPLNDRRKALQALQKLKTAKDINLLVLRDGITIPLYVPLQ